MTQAAEPPASLSLDRAAKAARKLENLYEHREREREKTKDEDGDVKRLRRKMKMTGKRRRRKIND